MDSHDDGNRDAADFERALTVVLAGEPLDRALPPGSAGAPDLDALQVLSAIGQASRALLFGEAEPPREATRWGHLEIRDEVGRGTSGTVYRAWDTRLAREVALKLFDPDSAAADAGMAEGRLLARLRHPHIVTVYGTDSIDGVSGLWMELVQGDTLEEMVDRDGPMSLEEALLTGIDLAGALAAVHAAGMLHRDVKTRNVVRQYGGRLVMMDFGAGHLSGFEPSAAGAGTPLYMAPEVLAGQPASVASDVYGLGVLLYHLVTGSYPVIAENLPALRAAHRDGQRRSLAESGPDMPAAARAVIERACAADPSDRFESAQQCEEALTEALAAVIAERARVLPTATRRWMRWRRTVFTAAALVSVIAATTSLAWNAGPGRAARRALGLPVPPRSPLYLGIGGSIAVVDAGRLRVVGRANPNAWALAVSERHGIRAMAGRPPWVGDTWMRLDGTPERASPAAEGLCCFYDGTTDGHYNYGLRQDSTLLEPIGSRPLDPAGVYRFDLEWRHGEMLFELGAASSAITSTLYGGIAFDRASGTLWVTRVEPSDDTAYAEQWSLQGRRLAVVPVSARARAIAVDAADGTLWVTRGEVPERVTHLDNFTTSGRRLGTFDVARPMNLETGGLEFVWPATP